MSLHKALSTLPSPSDTRSTIATSNIARTLLKQAVKTSDLDWRIDQDELTYVQNRGNTMGRVLGNGCHTLINDGMWRGTHVAIKSFSNDGMDANNTLQTFQDELYVVCRLVHPNIARVIGASDTIDREEYIQSFILVEKFPINFSAVVHTPGDVAVTLVDKVRILASIAEALHFLHTRVPQITHLNFTIEKIMLTAELQPKILDLGLSDTKRRLCMFRRPANRPRTMSYVVCLLYRSTLIIV